MPLQLQGMRCSPPRLRHTHGKHHRRHGRHRIAEESRRLAARLQPGRLAVVGEGCAVLWQRGSIVSIAAVMRLSSCTSRTYVWPVGVCRASVPRRSACGMHSARPHSLPFPAPCTVAHASCVLKQQSALRCTLFRLLRSYPEVCMRVGDLGRAEGRVPAHNFIGYC